MVVFSYQCRTGRLIEIRIASPFDLEQARALRQEALKLFQRKRGKLVCVVDLRKLEVLAPDVADDMGQNLKRANPHIERTGVLLPNVATVALQIDRLHREAESPVRRAFRRPEDLRVWLVEMLNDIELAALDRFLTEGA